MDEHNRGVLRLLPSSRYTIELLFDPGDSSTRPFRALDATSGDVVLGAALPPQLTFTFDRAQIQAAIR